MICSGGGFSSSENINYNLSVIDKKQLNVLSLAQKRCCLCREE